MNGPQHFAEAERLVELAESVDWTTEQEPYRAPALAAAQVHATLALVAATMDVAGATSNGVVTAGWSAALAVTA